MLRIRLTRTGKRNKGQFRLVVAEGARAVQGKFIEVLGHLDPHTKEKSFKKDRILHWISSGAKPSDTVYNMLISAGIIKGKKIKIKIKQKKKDEKSASSADAENKSDEKKPEIAEVKNETKEVKSEKPEVSEVKEVEKEEPKTEEKVEKKEEVKPEEKKE